MSVGQHLIQKQSLLVAQERVVQHSNTIVKLLIHFYPVARQAICRFFFALLKQALFCLSFLFEYRYYLLT